MKERTVQLTATMTDLVRVAHETDGPVTVFDGEDECLVVMRPAAFERLLFDGALLNGVQRETLRL